MGLVFNVDEVFEIAETIERNGAAFYRMAAEKISNPDFRKFLQELAGWEDTHLQIFSKMRQSLAGRECEPVTSDPEGLTGAYLKALADRRVFDYQQDPAKMFGDQTDLADIIRKAISLEKDSIVFYLGMKELVPTPMGQEKITDIIKEEMRHIAILSDRLASLPLSDKPK